MPCPFLIFTTMKVYICKVRNLFTNVYVKGQKHKIHFAPSHYESGNGVFCTTDKELQKAIENDALYKRGKIVLLHDLSDDKVSVETKKTSYPDVTTYLQAVRVLVDNYGIERKDIANKEMLREKVEELNIKFPNYKLKNDTE